MARYTFPTSVKSSTPRFIVLWELQEHVINCQRLEAATDLGAAMAATIEHLAADGWQPEGSADYGSVFVRCEGERRLLTITPWDPIDATHSLLTRSSRRWPRIQTMVRSSIDSLYHVAKHRPRRRLAAQGANP
jgi:hypothetical protein